MIYPLPPTFLNDTTEADVGAVLAQNMNGYTTAITGLDYRISRIEAGWVNVTAYGGL